MAKKPTPPKPGTTGSRKIIASGSSRTIVNKTLKPGSMATQTKIVTDKAAKKQPSLTSKAAKVVGKVAGTAAGIAKSKVKADVKAAKTVAGVAGKVAGKAAGVAKAIVKKERPVTKQMYRQVGKSGTTLKQLMNNKNIKKK